MKLSVPIYILKQQAKILSRTEGIPLHEALNRIASREGFRSWSLLSARVSSTVPVDELLGQLHPGEMMLLAARPGHGKTLLALKLAAHAARQGRSATFFTLCFTRAEVAACFERIRVDPSAFRDNFIVDDSDGICADYIISRLASSPTGSFVVIDYLQLLDQNRNHPVLGCQVRQLREFARQRQLVMLFLSQIDRSYDPAKRPFPEVDDVRLPNPVDLALFNKVCFLNEGRMQVASCA